jgi:phosphatidylinositol kinase/protein kinase (PI-3  family)
MSLCNEIFTHFRLDSMLHLRPYRIVSTGAASGVVHLIPDSISLDGLKKTPGFTTLDAYFRKVYSGPVELARARANFAASLAGYSVRAFLLLFFFFSFSSSIYSRSSYFLFLLPFY